MARLPVPGADDGVWGDVLNEYLEVEHNADGTLKSTGSLASKANDSAVVHLTGNETVAGVKTFSSSPVVPTPSSSSQAASKGYVDSALTGAPTVSSTAPSSPATNALWYDTTTELLKRWSGSAWVIEGSSRYATMPNGGLHIFTSNTDPAGSAIDGDIWLAP